MRDRTIFAHTVLEFGGCRWVGRQPPCVREDRKMESKGGVYLALDFIIRYPSKGVFISTRAPAWGATRPVRRRYGVQHHFYSRPRVGGDTLGGCP